MISIGEVFEEHKKKNPQMPVQVQIKVQVEVQVYTYLFVIKTSNYARRKVFAKNEAISISQKTFLLRKRFFSEYFL